MVRTKKTLASEWEERKSHFLSSDDIKGQRYCIHWWNSFDCDDHGDGITHSKSYPRTDAGWRKAEKLARKCVDAGYRVSINKTGSI